MLRAIAVHWLAILLASPVVSELFYEVSWQVQGDSGFSAPNAICNADGAVQALVVCEGNTGVVCLDLSGERLWDYAMEPPVTAAPAVADLDGDGAEDIVAADAKGTVIALSSKGGLLWRACVPGRVEADSCPAIADLDDDGRPEVLVGDVTGALSCLAHDGSLRWRFIGEGSQMGPPLVADIYDAPGREVIVTSHDSHIYALDAHGRWLWDLHCADDLFPNSTPLLADVDGDNVPELYVGGGLHHFYRVDLENHRIALAENVYLHINNCISASDIDGDGKDEVVFGVKGVNVFCYADGGMAWQQSFSHSGFYASPAFLDLDGDPELEILLHSIRGDVHALNPDGSEFFSAKAPCAPLLAPLLGDLDGDGLVEAVITNPGATAGGGLMAWIELGVPFREDPRNRLVFAGNRARTCRPKGTRAWPLLPTPKALAANGEATLACEKGVFVVLGGTNTYRAAVVNPTERRLAVLMRLTNHEGAATEIVRHVRSAAERVSFTFPSDSQGEYARETRLVDADSMECFDTHTASARYDGAPMDAAHLQNLFAHIDALIADWERTNAPCAASAKRELAAYRGTASAAPDTPAGLRQRVERFAALLDACASLASEGSFFAWPFCPWAYFHPRETIPAPGDTSVPADVALCIGEYESRAFNITNASGNTLNVRVRCATAGTPLDGHVTLRRAVLVPTFRREEVADALPLVDQAGLLTIAPFETAQLWITVDAVGVPPGDYETPLELQSLEADPTMRSIPLRVTVHDLVLPRPRPLRFCLWAYDGSDLGTDKPHVLDDLVEHGCTVFFGKAPGAECNAEGRLVGPLDFTAHDENLARLHPHGCLLYPSPQGALRGQPFLSEPWRKGFVAYMRAWAAHMKELGIDYNDWALYPYDEPSTPQADTTLNLVEVATLVREADPKILVYTDPTSGTTMETVEMFTGLIDIWCPSSELLERLGPEIVPVAHDVGKEVWFYDAAGRSKTLSCLGIYRRRFWYAWNQGFTGAGWWCYAHHGDVDRWLGPNPTGDFFATVYDGPGGHVIPSKRWEIAREGVEDYEYLWMLREAVHDAEARGAAPATARALLEAMPIEIERTLHQTGRRLPLTPDSVPLYTAATERLQQARDAIVQACLALHADSTNER